MASSKLSACLLVLLVSAALCSAHAHDDPAPLQHSGRTPLRLAIRMPCNYPLMTCRVKTFFNIYINSCIDTSNNVRVLGAATAMHAGGGRTAMQVSPLSPNGVPQCPLY